MKGAFVRTEFEEVAAYLRETTRLLANLMLPDGAERQPADWTVFFLNQTPFNQIAPVLALEDTPSTGPDESTGELLYVLNLVRTKHDSSKRR